MPEGRTTASDGVLHLGLDLGSVSFKVAVVDADSRILHTEYRRHHGQPIPTVLTMLAELLGRYGQLDPALRRWPGHVGVTGTGGRLLARLLGATFVNEIVSQGTAIYHLHPEVRTLIEMGGEDSKLICMQPSADGQGHIEEFAMNSVCAAGTGSFLDQQASRLGLRIEDEFGQLALKSANPPRVAGRCSVFAKSDMIHLQQQATPDYDIVAGLCVGLARNFKSNVGKGIKFKAPLAFCGGVAANAGVVRAFEMVLETGPGELIVPDEHLVTGAIGAALTCCRRDPDRTSTDLAGLDALRQHLGQKSDGDEHLAPLEPPGEVKRLHRTDSPVLPTDGERVRAYLGVDVGSISTNVVVMDEEHRVLAKAYLMTAGRPIEAIRQGLSQVGAEIGDQVEIAGAGTTGSGRYLTGDIIGADLVVNEITAQATAAALLDPEVDTIFEIGGQDSKYISLRDGVVVDFEMNHACAAGTGSFLEEQAEKLNISIKEEFGRMALESTKPVRLGERCTVFMESDLQSYLQKGSDRKDLIAGLSYSIVANYLNRVVGKRRVGDRIFFQGGVAFNRGVVAAFGQVTGKPITVPEHHEVTGAIGMAVLAKRHAEQQGKGFESTFQGFDLADRHYDVESFECEHCANNCEIKKVTFEGQSPIFYGSRCDRYNVRKDEELAVGIPDLFAERQRMLEEHVRKPEPAGSRGTVGIPMALSNYQLLPFWSVLFRELGYTPVISGRSTKKIIRRGVEVVTAQQCFPVKVFHGHAAALMERQVDWLWLPSVVAMAEEGDGANNNYLCPYVQSIPYQVRAALDFDAGPTKLLYPPVRFQDGPVMLTRDLQQGLCKPLGVSKGQVGRAAEAAAAAQEAFEKACVDRGAEVLAELGPDRQGIVIVSRPYNGCDRGICLDLPAKMRRMGVLPIPMDFLNLRSGSKQPPWENMYWKYGQQILHAAHLIVDNPNLQAIYLSNFSCGPDSFLITFFKRILRDRPSLTLEIDEHSADAGVVTRLEAFLDSLKHAQVRGDGRRNGQALPPRGSPVNRKLLIPRMCDHSFALAAAFRRCGQPSAVIAPSDEDSLVRGRQVCTGKECLPCIVTAGDMLRELAKPDVDPKRTAFFMPGGDGPCRFGQYNCLHRIILDEQGYGDVPVISPNQGNSFYKDFLQFQRDPTRDAWEGIVAIDLLQKVRLKVRPYERDPGQSDRLYDRLVQQVAQRIEKGRGLLSLMVQAARALDAVPRDTSRGRPRIGIVGEIYVRTHEFSNSHVIRRLEALGAEVALASFGEWIYYTNHTRARASVRERRPGTWLRNFLKGFFQHRSETRLAKPLEAVFGPLCDPPVRHVLKLAAPYMHESFEGEAILSVGKTVEYFHDGFDGVVNVMPFTCMPSTIVSSVMKSVRDQIGTFPVLSISYDGQRDAATQTRLEAMIHQVSQYRAKRLAGNTHPV